LDETNYKNQFSINIMLKDEIEKNKGKANDPSQPVKSMI
jgi:hypothetical protein